jgi:hypothetical protein
MADIVKIAPGVVRSFDGKRAIYTGRADDLIAAGLVERRQLPGEHGNDRGMCTFDAAGEPAGFEPGKGRSIERVGFKQIVAQPRKIGTVYEVRMVLSPDRAAAIRAESEVKRPLPAPGRQWPFPASYGGQQMGVRA